MNKNLICAALAAAVCLAACGDGGGGGGGPGASVTLASVSTSRPTAASVSGVNSADAGFSGLATPKLGQQAYFQVSGAKLSGTLALSVTDCTRMTTISITPTEARFKCTPAGSAGIKAVTIRDKTGGATLYTGSVAVQDPNAPALATPFPLPTRGFNLGNSLEAIWGYSIPGQSVFISAANAGFNAVRIPCAWDSNADPVTHQINADYMAKVKQAVDSSIAAGMYAVINVHWDGGWFDSHIGDTVDPALDAKVRAFWTQIAATFAGYDNHLVFAAANEPDIKSPTQMKTLVSYYQTFVNTVRAAGGNNANRWLVLQGGGDTSWFTTLPTDSTAGRLAVEFHNYTPSLFTIIHNDQSWGNAMYFWGPAYHYAGNPARNAAAWGEEGAIDAGMEQLKVQFADKGVPVMVGEFQAAGTPGLTGTEQVYNNASRLYWNKFVAESARAHGLSPFYWSTPNAPFKYDTGAITDPDLVTALTGGVAPPPPNGAPYAVTGVAATASAGQVALTWQPVAGATSYNIYRAAASGNEPVAPSVSGIAGTSYTDTGLNDGTTYFYRVTAVNGSGVSGFSTEARARTPGVNPDPAKFSFEADTQLFSSGSAQVTVDTSATQHFAGNRSLAVNFGGTAAGTSSVEASGVVVPAGATVTFHVWIPTGSPVTTVEPYLQDYHWAWASTPYGGLTAGAWNTVTLTVPATAIAPLNRLGLRFTTSAAWTGTIYVDSIDWL
ncbi:cellulase family glycosylhydrolase [Rugamonas sp. A1-17]|nr:cellulase family glycosylhydrolase [Rugamonas sp. A1-17]